MTETERKALALLNEVAEERGRTQLIAVKREGWVSDEALCRALEQHEAFRQEVSDAVEQYWASLSGAFVAKPPPYMARFIIAKPDPLVEVFDECFHQEVREGETWSEAMARKFRAASEKRGGKIVWGEG